MFSLNSVLFIIPRQSLEETNPARRPPSTACWRILTTSLWPAPTPWGRQAHQPQTREPPAVVQAIGKKTAFSPSRSIPANLTPLLTMRLKSTEKRVSMEMIWTRFIKAATLPGKMGTYWRCNMGRPIILRCRLCSPTEPGFLQIIMHTWTHWANPASTVTSSGASREPRAAPLWIIRSSSYLLELQGPSLDDYDRRPKSSYLCQTSPQPAMRQRSRSGSGLQEPMMPFGESAFKTHPQGHSYSSYTYPRLSEPTVCVPKVTFTASLPPACGTSTRCAPTTLLFAF